MLIAQQVQLIGLHDHLVEELATDVRIEQAPSQIGRSNRATTLAITANLAPGVEMDKAQKAIDELKSTIELEPGYSIGLGEDFNFGQDASKQMLLNTVLAFGLIFILVFAAVQWI